MTSCTNTGETPVPASNCSRVHLTPSVPAVIDQLGTLEILASVGR